MTDTILSSFQSCWFACVKMDTGSTWCHWKTLQKPSWMEKEIGWGLSAQQKRPGGNNPVSGYLQAVHNSLLPEAAERFPTVGKQQLIGGEHGRGVKDDLGEAKGSSWQPQEQLEETLS